jgi:hypothetical protein
MTQKLIVSLEVTKGDYTFIFSMPVGASLGSAYDAAFDVLTEITKMTKEATDKSAPKQMEMTAEQLQDAIDKAN